LWYPDARLRAIADQAKTVIGEPSFRLRNVYRVLTPERSIAISQRYIVHADLGDIYSGLGCNLYLLPVCWAYARATGRTLVVDWRGSPYLRRSPERNLFSVLFDPLDPNEVGVECLSDDTVNDIEFPQPVLGPSEPLRQEWGLDSLPNGGLELFSFTELLRRGLDVPISTVLPGLNALWEARALEEQFQFPALSHFYRSLRVKATWWRLATQFVDEHMAGHRVIGVHVRQGNGEELYTSHFLPRVIHDLSSFMDELADRLKRLGERKYPDGYRILLCTDSDKVIREAQHRLTNVVFRPSWKPQEGEGISFDHSYDHPMGPEATAVEALLDMILLSFCDIVVQTRTTAFTSYIPYVLKREGAVFLKAEEFFA
jgi:hypothetical protein